MLDFAAIDFETANNERSSICSVGVVIVRNGQIVDKIYRLIRPTPNYYSYFNTRVHGLTREDTKTGAFFVSSPVCMDLRVKTRKMLLFSLMYGKK